MADKMGGSLPPSGFGLELRRVREAKGWTQKQVADAAGLHPNTVARMERGEVEPSWQVVLAMGAALGVPCTAFTGAAVPDGSADAHGGGADAGDEPAAKGKRK